MHTQGATCPLRSQQKLLRNSYTHINKYNDNNGSWVGTCAEAEMYITTSCQSKMSIKATFTCTPSRLKKMQLEFLGATATLPLRVVTFSLLKVYYAICSMNSSSTFWSRVSNSLVHLGQEQSDLVTS